MLRRVHSLFQDVLRARSSEPPEANIERLPALAQELWDGLGLRGGGDPSQKGPLYLEGGAGPMCKRAGRRDTLGGPKRDFRSCLTETPTLRAHASDLISCQVPLLTFRRASTGASLTQRSHQPHGSLAMNPRFLGLLRPPSALDGSDVPRSQAAGACEVT